MADDRRRATLAALSPNQVHGRASLAPSRFGKDGKALRKSTGLGGRPSLLLGKQAPTNAPSRLAYASAPRRSSSYGKTAAGAKPDPRPVSDKAFQASCARCLIAYLSTHGYDQPVSPKILASPMSKDFTSIVHFLMRQVDPHLNQKLLGKIEEDVPTFFKRMRYPFQISKSSLFAVGSPHTWPSLLAALVWIVELLNYSHKAAKTAADMVDERQKAESDFFEYVAESYGYFLAGDDAKCEEVDVAKEAEFNATAEETRARNAQLQQETELLQQQIREIENSPSPLVAAQATLDEQRADGERFTKLIESLTAAKQALQVKLQERQSDLKSKMEQLALAEQEVKELQEKVAAQVFNREDVTRMNEDRMKKENILHSAEVAREACQKRVREQEVDVEERLDDLEAKLQDYNTAADRLQLIPATAKRAGGMCFEAKLNRTGTSATEIVSIDFKGAVKTALARIKDGAVERTRQLVEDSLALQERLDALSHGLTERTEENAILKTQVHRLEKNLMQCKEEREAEIRTILQEAEQLKTEVASLKDVTSNSIAHSSGRVRALQTQYEDTVKTCDLERNVFLQDLAAALHMLAEHKQQVSTVLQRTHAEVKEVTDEIIALRV